MQLVDELSMIYTTCLMCFATFSYGKSQRYSIILAISLVGLALFITLYYHYLQDPAFHQNAYAILTAIVLFRAMYVMEVNIRPRFRVKEKAPGASQEREDRRDKAILKQMWTMIVCGLSIFLGGFLLWHLDNVHCSKLRRWRREIGMPWGFLLEGHGWWHLMTGTGAYFYIVWGIWLRHCLNGRQDEYALRWPWWYSLPAIVRRESQAGDGHVNVRAHAQAKKEL
jgi:dihydroceramidase